MATKPMPTKKALCAAAETCDTLAEHAGVFNFGAKDALWAAARILRAVADRKKTSSGG